MNGDTSVNTVDVIAIQRFFLGLSTGIANTGKYKFTPVNRTYTAIVTNQTGQGYDTLVFGDVDRPIFHVMAATFETLAHLELARIEGRARKTERDGRTLYIVANNYGASGASEGIVMIEQVDVPHAGRP